MSSDSENPANTGPTPRREPATPADVRACVDTLRRACGDALVGVIFFGSRFLQTSPDQHSAADLFLVVSDYGRFYRRLHDEELVHRAPGLLARLNRWLPPNVTLLRPPSTDGPGCKCCVISERDLERELSPHARDHFCKGRLGQTVAVIHARQPADGARLARQLDAAREDSLVWVPSHLPERFTAEQYCRAMLGVSFGSEIRPESPGRVEEVLAAQRQPLQARTLELLRGAAGQRQVEEVAPGEFRLREGARTSPRRLYFRRTRWRATLRWLKHPLTFDQWLDYIVRKVNRRTGMRVELTPAERRWPLLLLWPKLVKVLWGLRHPPRDADASKDVPPTGGRT